MRCWIPRGLKLMLVIGFCSAATATGALGAQPGADVEAKLGGHDPNVDPNANQRVVEAAVDVGGAVKSEIPSAATMGPDQLYDDIRIDLSNQVGTTGGNWNNITNLTGPTAGLIDFNTGAVTAVSIDGTGSSWQAFFGDDAGAFPDQDWLIQPATMDGAGLSFAQTGSFEITGLTGLLYQIEVVSARTQFDYMNTVTVNGSLANRTFLGTPVQTPWGSTSDGLTPGNWLIWDAVSPVGGVITISDTAAPDSSGIVNAIRILVEVVPVELQSFNVE